jgi:hypothetical protein
MVGSKQKSESLKKGWAMNFRASFCDPFNPNIIELGNIQKESIIDKFESIDWADYLRRMAMKSKTKTQNTGFQFLPSAIQITMSFTFSISDLKK